MRIGVPNSLSPDSELLYFSSTDAEVPRGTVNLRGCEVREVLGSKYENHFQVWHAVNHCLMLRAASRSAMLAWTRVLRIAIAACEPGWDPAPFDQAAVTMTNHRAKGALAVFKLASQSA